MADGNEKDYEVVDKRKVKLDDEGNVVSEPEAEQPQEAQVEEDLFEGLPPVDVDSMLKSFVGLLSMHAWQWLGLVKDPRTNDINQDLEQARVAIDSIGALAKQLESRVDVSERKEIEDLLGSLRMNFVQQSAKKSE